MLYRSIAHIHYARSRISRGLAVDNLNFGLSLITPRLPLLPRRCVLALGGHLGTVQSIHRRTIDCDNSIGCSVPCPGI